jgi:hypothetical protein
VILGSLPGRPSELSNTSKGFYDPNGIYPKYKNEPDVNRLAVNLKDSENNEINPHLALTLRRSTRITGIATADFNTSRPQMALSLTLLMATHLISQVFHTTLNIHTITSMKVKVDTS